MSEEKSQDPNVTEFRSRLSGRRLELFDNQLDDKQREIVARFGVERKGRIHFDLLEEQGLVVYGKPDRMAWKKYLRAMPEDKGELDKVIVASDNLCIDCVLYPTKDRMLTIFDDAPGHSVDAAEVLALLAKGHRPK